MHRTASVRIARHFLIVLCLGAALLSPAPSSPVERDWVRNLERTLARIDAESEGSLGLHVRRLEDGSRLEYHANRLWYLGSATKVPVAVALLLEVESGEISLDQELVLQREHYVDGSGGLLWKEPGTRLRVGYLLEQMLTHSDSTAADLIIRLIGVEEVNRLVREKMVARGFGPITTLLQVRKDAYGELHPGAAELSNMDFIELKKIRSPRARIEALRRKLGIGPGELKARTLREAFERYYERGLNSATLEAFGELLSKLARGELLRGDNTRLVLRMMERMTTGDRRIKAGLPPFVRFAQKTGTQLGRVCNAGIMRTSRAVRDSVVVAACLEKFDEQSDAERTLRRIGAAIWEAGLLQDPAHSPDRR